MKKVLIGILILIPIIILLVVALVTNLLQLQAWIAVEDLAVNYKDSERAVGNIKLYLDVNDDTVFDFNDYVDVLVLPEKANQYTVEWAFGNLECSEEYLQEYENSLNDPSATPMHPAAILVDEDGREVDVNTSGKFKIFAYCSFDVSVSAETVKRNFSVEIVGNTVHSATLLDPDGKASADLTVGQSKRLCASYVPVDSIVTKLEFESDDASVATVDENGVVTAVGVGKANITVKVDKYNSEDGEFVLSNAYSVTVVQGASAFGDNVTLARRADDRYTFEMLGVDGDSVSGAVLSGCSMYEDGLEIVGDSASIVFANGKTLRVAICEEGAIEIVNSELFSMESGYVLGVGEAGLKLTARRAATAAKEGPLSVAWSSSDEEVAEVSADGKVVGLKEGSAEIRAEADGFGAAFTVNVRQKVSSLRLKTSNESLEAGLARQTVFASDRYVYLTAEEGGEHYRDKEANSLLIRIYDEPEDATDEAIRAFYDRYIFEIAEGGEFGNFDKDIPNKLVFNSKALEGKSLQTLRIKVSARYPRFETAQSHTTSYVNINAIFGVQADTFEQAIRASADQKEYADAESNVIPENTEEIATAPNGVTYLLRTAQSSKTRYAITLGCDIAPEQGKVLGDGDGQLCFRLYGDLYGNGHMISAKEEQVVESSSYLAQVTASNVTVSNVYFRHIDKEIEKLDSDTFKNGYCLEISRSSGRTHLTGVRVEYCVMENSYGALTLRHSEATVDGCVFRNISSVAVYTYARVDDDVYLRFTHLTMNNSVFSSIMGLAINMSYERFSKDDKGAAIFSSDPDPNKAIEESYKWVQDVLVPKNCCHILKQTGFLDIYNWQNASKATLIDTGNKTLNGVIGTATGVLMENHPAFKQGIYPYNGIKYVHLGFMAAGIVAATMTVERNFSQITLEDDRFYSVYVPSLADNVEGLDHDTRFVIDLIKGYEMTLYGYKNTASLTPASTYQINNKFIDHLHGKA